MAGDDFQATTSKNPKSGDWVRETRRLIRYSDLNGQGSLFGGILAMWMDEAAALYAMCQMKRDRVVTLRISELLYKLPIRLHDALEFQCRTSRIGKTSLTVEVRVLTILTPNPKEVCRAELQFVAVDKDGRSEPWR